MEQKENSGAIFRNDKKGNEKAPDYRGNAVVNGKLMKISAWVNTPKNGGDKYLSLKFEEDVPKATNEQTSTILLTQSDDLPF